MEKLRQLEEEMAGLARKMQTRESAHNSTKSVPPPSKISEDSHSQEDGGGSNHVTNGVAHHPE